MVYDNSHDWHLLLRRRHTKATPVQCQRIAGDRSGSRTREWVARSGGPAKWHGRCADARTVQCRGAAASPQGSRRLTRCHQSPHDVLSLRRWTARGRKNGHRPLCVWPAWLDGAIHTHSGTSIALYSVSLGPQTVKTYHHDRPAAGALADRHGSPPELSQIAMARRRSSRGSPWLATGARRNPASWPARPVRPPAMAACTSVRAARATSREATSAPPKVAGATVGTQFAVVV